MAQTHLLGRVPSGHAPPPITSSASGKADRPSGELRASGSSPPALAPKTSALADAGVVTGPARYVPTAKDLRPATVALGGLGRSFNVIKNYLRDQLLGASGARKGTDPHETWNASGGKRGDGAWEKTRDPAGHTVSKLAFHRNEVRSLPNVGAMSVTNPKGHRLDGHFYTPARSLAGGTKLGQPDTSKPVVLLLTGSAGTAEEYGFHLGKNYSQNLDANVMSVNFRGYGSSQGKPTEKGLYQDAQAMYRHLVQDLGFKPDQVVVHGYSMGAAVAAQLHKAADEQGVQLKGVVYDRPMVSARDATVAHTGSSRIGAIAKWGVGKMDVVNTVPGLNGKATPVVVSHDKRKEADGSDNEFALQGKRFGEGLQTVGFTNVRVVATAAAHDAHDDATQRMSHALSNLLA